MAKRRSNGEGNIRKRKDGRWEGRYIKGYDSDGKSIPGYVYGKTYKEAKEKLFLTFEGIYDSTILISDGKIDDAMCRYSK